MKVKYENFYLIKRFLRGRIKEETIFAAANISTMNFRNHKNRDIEFSEKNNPLQFGLLSL